MRTRGRWQGFVLVGVVAVATVAGMDACSVAAERTGDSGLVRGIGRIEASEIAVATSMPGRIDRILVQEGQSVRAGQLLAHMHVRSLMAERAEAYARYRHALFLAASAETDVLVRESETQVADLAARDCQREFEAVIQRLSSAVMIAGTGATSVSQLEELRAEARRAGGAAASADARLAAARMTVVAARLQAQTAHAAVGAAEATVRRVEATLADAALTSPRDAEVQSRIARPGDVLPAGGRVLSLVDTTDVYMTFTLPEATVDGVSVGDEARIVLDSVPQSVVRATISSVESSGPTLARQNITNERQRPMCRLTAQIDRALLQRELTHVKAGMRGVAWLRLDPASPWPSTLRVMEP
jgi:HlyD family secretion protein